MFLSFRWPLHSATVASVEIHSAFFRKGLQNAISDPHLAMRICALSLPTFLPFLQLLPKSLGTAKHDPKSLWIPV